MVFIMNEIVTAVSTVGFPVVMSLVLMKFIENLNEAHREDLKEMTKAVNNNTVILQRLFDKLDDND